jgi:hypothetical protein
LPADGTGAARRTSLFGVHGMGVVLFLFIPLVLILFLRFPLGVTPSFVIALAVMFGHRLAAIPFMNRRRLQRCLWCGRTARDRAPLELRAGRSRMVFECCRQECVSRARRFFDFTARNALLFRAGIFLPLAWYVVSMLLVAAGWFSFSLNWNRFIFQFCIACSVVSISFLYRSGEEVEEPSFPFPIHNLFLLGIRNTLLIFRVVGIWWIAVSLAFLYRQARPFFE